MSVPGVSTVGSVISRTVGKVSGHVKADHWIKTVAMTSIGVIILIVIAIFAGQDRDTDEGKKRVGKTVSNWVDMIVIYGVMVIGALTLMSQAYFAVSVIGMRKDFDDVSRALENIAKSAPAASAASEEILSGLSINF